MNAATPGPEQNVFRIGDLELSLEEARRILTAVRMGAVDALVVTGNDGERIYTLEGADDSYRLLIEQMTEGALLLSLEGDVLYCNRRCAELLRCPLEEIGGQSFSLHVPESERAGYYALLEQARDGEGRVELHLSDNKGVWHPVLMSMRAMQLHGMTVLSAVVTDIAERLRLEEALRQSARLAAIGQVMAGLSHESRNALQRGLAASEMLLRRVGDQPKIMSLLQEVRKAQEDLQRVYEGVQSYAAPIRLDIKEQDVAACWRAAWHDLAQRRALKHASLTEVTDGADTRCAVDAFWLKNVFRNLFENSLAACPAPVTVSVTCESDSVDGMPAVGIHVVDNGPGVSQEEATAIFQPFYTTKTKGTGLGLPIVRRIVEAHGGTIDVAHSEGPGLELLLRLPKTAPPSCSSQHAPFGIATTLFE
jgi:PAS domain S-box-containing protein